MTNKEKINSMTSKEFADEYAKYMCNIQYCEVGYKEACPCYELCDIFFDTNPGDKFPGCTEIFRRWLESEVEENVI